MTLPQQEGGEIAFFMNLGYLVALIHDPCVDKRFFVSTPLFS